MTVIKRGKVAQYFSDGDAAITKYAKGKALEDLIDYVFGLVPGLTISSRNQMNAFDAEEIDLAFWNDQHIKGLKYFDSILLVECKNWSTAIGYPELEIFNGKLTSRGRSMGILVASKGITGVPEELTRAHSVIAKALVDKREIIVITRDELLALTNTDELVLLLKRKRAQLAVSGTIYV